MTHPEKAFLEKLLTYATVATIGAVVFEEALLSAVADAWKCHPHSWTPGWGRLYISEDGGGAYEQPSLG